MARESISIFRLRNMTLGKLQCYSAILVTSSRREYTCVDGSKVSAFVKKKIIQNKVISCHQTHIFLSCVLLW